MKSGLFIRIITDELLTFALVAVFFIDQQICEGITVQDNISNMAHIVGGIIGGILGYGLNKKDRFIR